MPRLSSRIIGVGSLVLAIIAVVIAAASLYLQMQPDPQISLLNAREALRDYEALENDYSEILESTTTPAARLERLEDFLERYEGRRELGHAPTNDLLDSVGGEVVVLKDQIAAAKAHAAEADRIAAEEALRQQQLARQAELEAEQRARIAEANQQFLEGIHCRNTTCSDFIIP